MQQPSNPDLNPRDHLPPIEENHVVWFGNLPDDPYKQLVSVMAPDLQYQQRKIWLQQQNLNLRQQIDDNNAHVCFFIA